MADKPSVLVAWLRRLAKSGGQVDELLAACWEETLDAGPYDFGEKPIDWGKLLRHHRSLVLGVDVERVGRMVVRQRLTAGDGLLQLLGVLLALHHGAEVDHLRPNVAAHLPDELVGHRLPRPHATGSGLEPALTLGHGSSETGRILRGCVGSAPRAWGCRRTCA